VQRFTVAFNFLCVLLGLLYEGRHLSSSVRRKVSVNLFYSTFTKVFYFCHVFTFLIVFLFWGNVFLIYAFQRSSGIISSLWSRSSSRFVVRVCVSGRQLSNEMTFDLDIWHAGSP